MCGEHHRFEKLMEYFRNEESNIDFMVSSGAQPGPVHSRCKVQPEAGYLPLQSMRTEWLLGEGRMSERGSLEGVDMEKYG